MTVTRCATCSRACSRRLSASCPAPVTRASSLTTSWPRGDRRGCRPALGSGHGVARDGSAASCAKSESRGASRASSSTHSAREADPRDLARGAWSRPRRARRVRRSGGSRGARRCARSRSDGAVGADRRTECPVAVATIGSQRVGRPVTNTTGSPRRPGPGERVDGERRHRSVRAQQRAVEVGGHQPDPPDERGPVRQGHPVILSRRGVQDGTRVPATPSTCSTAWPAASSSASLCGRPMSTSPDRQPVHEAHGQAEHGPAGERRRGARGAAPRKWSPVTQVALPRRGVRRCDEHVGREVARERRLEHLVDGPGEARGPGRGVALVRRARRCRGGLEELVAEVRELEVGVRLVERDDVGEAADAVARPARRGSGRGRP